jgi:hypothetical protein
MYRINYTGRPVLITHDEVLFHAATDSNVDPRQIMQNIIVAEERWIAPALCDEFYYDFVNKKNKKISVDNQAQMVIDINASLTAQGKPTITAADIPIGTWINAIEFVTDAALVELWEMFLWKVTAEAVDLATIIPSWLRHTSQGQQKNNPEVIGGSGQGSASGDRRDVQFKIDKAIQDRIDPLLERMHLWLCKRKSSYPLYCKPCECDNPNGVSFKRKTDWVFGGYDSKSDGACNTCDPCANGITTESGNCIDTESGNDYIVGE